MSRVGVGSNRQCQLITLRIMFVQGHCPFALELAFVPSFSLLYTHLHFKKLKPSRQTRGVTTRIMKSPPSRKMRGRGGNNTNQNKKKKAPCAVLGVSVPFLSSLAAILMLATVLALSLSWSSSSVSLTPHLASCLQAAVFILALCLLCILLAHPRRPCTHFHPASSCSRQQQRSGVVWW